MIGDGHRRMRVVDRARFDQFLSKNAMLQVEVRSSSRVKRKIHLKVGEVDTV